MPTLRQVQGLKARLGKSAESILGLRTTAEMLTFLESEVAITTNRELLKAKGTVSRQHTFVYICTSTLKATLRRRG